VGCEGDQRSKIPIQKSCSCFKYGIDPTPLRRSHCFFLIEFLHFELENFKMPSELIKRHEITVSRCYKRLSNSVIGSAWACLGISNEINDVGMHYTCMHPAFGLLQSEFCAMHNALKDLPFILDTPVWHMNATMTVKRVQEAVQKVAYQVQDVIRRSQIWTVVAPDYVNDRLHSLAISLQEQRMTLELLTVIMAFVDSELHGPAVLQHYRHVGRYVEKHSGTV
jgi:hypothetical protein